MPEAKEALERLTAMEPVLEWSPDLVCGVATIDAQHRSILLDAKALLLAVNSHSPDVLAHFDALLSHIMAHFRDEEEVLLAVGYCDFARHRRFHAALVDSAMELRERLLTGRARYEQFFDYLVHDVVEDHLLIADREFFPVLKASNYADTASVESSSAVRS